VFANTKEAQIAALKHQVPKLDRKMNVTFSKTDIRQVIFFFSSEFDMNIIANTEVVGDISFGFKNINIVDAFDASFRFAHLHQKRGV
jgi:type II secretory pathway component HofQ